MCNRNTYARALVEVSSTNALMESLVIAIPFANGTGHTLEKIEIEYEWQPPRCATCKIFDHADEHCPKKMKTDAPTKVSNDGFVEVTRKNGKGKQHSHSRQIDGIRLTKPKPNYLYRPLNKPNNEKGETSHSHPNNKVDNPSSSTHSTGRNEVETNVNEEATGDKNKGKNTFNVEEINMVPLKNSFDTLMEKDKILDMHTEPNIDIGNELVNSDNEEVEEVFVEKIKAAVQQSTGNENDVYKGASTPCDNVHDV
ncbi:zinc knuckle CX2CX4HX4C containing protein [Tanacetum coccineum]